MSLSTSDESAAPHMPNTCSTTSVHLHVHIYQEAHGGLWVAFWTRSTPTGLGSRLVGVSSKTTYSDPGVTVQGTASDVDELTPTSDVPSSTSYQHHQTESYVMGKQHMWWICTTTHDTPNICSATCMLHLVYATPPTAPSGPFGPHLGGELASLLYICPNSPPTSPTSDI